MELKLDDLTTKIDFRMPSGARISHVFYRTDTVKTLHQFISLQDLQNFEILVPIPRKVYSDLDETLDDAKLCPRALLTVNEN